MPLDLFSKTAIPFQLPQAMEEVIGFLQESSDKEDCLRRAYGVMTVKYQGNRIKTLTKLLEIFRGDVGYFWNKNGFLHCTNINFLMRVVLVRSGFFSDDEIELKWTQIRFLSPHQYLKVKVSDKYVNVDVWGYVYGVGFGDFAHGFR